MELCILPPPAMPRRDWKGFLLERVKASWQDGSLTLLRSLSPAVEWDVPTHDGDMLAPTQPRLSHADGIT